MAVQVPLTELHSESWIARLKSTLIGWRWRVTSWRGIACKWLWKQRTGIMNNEAENWKLNKIDAWINCVRSRECRICRFWESNFQFFFPEEHAREPPYIICAIGADSTLLSPATLALNAVQLQKSSYLDKMNDDTEKHWSKIYIILDENCSLNTKETI